MAKEKDIWMNEIQNKSGLRLLLSVREAAQPVTVQEQSVARRILYSCLTWGIGNQTMPFPRGGLS
jgi:hypothetical protein